MSELRPQTFNSFDVSKFYFMFSKTSTNTTVVIMEYLLNKSLLIDFKLPF